MRESTILIGAFILAASAVGCGKSSNRATVYPVSGKVLVEGAAAEGARVVFYPTSGEMKKPGMPLPAGDTDASGVYHLQSYGPADGAPVGEYQVTVSVAEPLPPNVSREEFHPKDRFAGKYIDPATSKLTAKVEKGGGEIPPFDLK